MVQRFYDIIQEKMEQISLGYEKGTVAVFYLYKKNQERQLLADMSLLPKR